MEMNPGLPNSFQIELVEGCTRQCVFCGINGIRKKPGSYNFMKEETYNEILIGISELRKKPRIDFAMHGEPSMHRERFKFIAMARKTFPQAQLTFVTNGVRYMNQYSAKDEIRRLFNNGINCVLVDTYEPERLRLRKLFLEVLNKTFVVHDFYERTYNPYQHNGHKHRLVLLMDDIISRDSDVKSRQIFNHAGGSALSSKHDLPRKSPCSLPFRDLSICWNGDVCICCMDFAHELVCGNVHNNQTLKEIWNGKVYQSARKYLQNKMRAFSPCARCDAGAGTRWGLTPKYPLPKETDSRIIRDNVTVGNSIKFSSRIIP